MQMEGKASKMENGLMFASCDVLFLLITGPRLQWVTGHRLVEEGDSGLLFVGFFLV
jgi:hypothetical protein